MHIDLRISRSGVRVPFGVPKIQIPFGVSGFLFLPKGTRKSKWECPADIPLPPVSTAATPYDFPEDNRHRVPFGVPPKKPETSRFQVFLTF